MHKDLKIDELLTLLISIDNHLRHIKKATICRHLNLDKDYKFNKYFSCRYCDCSLNRGETYETDKPEGDK